MADISKIKLPGSETIYNVKDQGARESIELLNPDIINSNNLKFNNLSDVALGYNLNKDAVDITWNGDTTGKLKYLFRYYKISDNIVLPSIGSTCAYVSSGETVITTVETIEDASEELGYKFNIAFYIYDADNNFDAMVVLEPIQLAGINWEPGTYFSKNDNLNYTSSMHVDAGIIKNQIPAQYLRSPIIDNGGVPINTKDTIAVGWKEKSDELTTITWDGDTTGKLVIDFLDGQFCQVSDEFEIDLVGCAIQKSDSTSSTIDAVYDIGKVLAELENIMLWAENEELGVIILILTKDGTDGSKAGIYFPVAAQGESYVSSLSFYPTIYHKIPSYYLDAATSGGGAITNSATANITIDDSHPSGYSITHSLNTYDVMVQIYDKTSYETVIAEVTRTGLNTINVNFNNAPAVGSQFRVMMMSMNSTTTIPDGEEVEF